MAMIEKFVCGSDTIFCLDEFGIDDGYYANYPNMRGNSVAYAASFGDSHFTEESYQVLNERLANFKALGLREQQMLPYVTAHTSVPAQKVLDPTLLLNASDYDSIAEKRIVPEKYLLLYARRNNPTMMEFAEKIAKENGWKIIDISLRATNAERGHQMFYQVGVEEFLSLVKYSQAVITNSYHGLIFGVQYRKSIHIFTREQADRKISNVLKLCGIEDRIVHDSETLINNDIDYDLVHKKLAESRKTSIEFLKSELKILAK